MTSFWPVPLTQPDRRTCGPSVLVALRMAESPDYRDRVLAGGPRSAQARFASEARAAHRTTSRVLDGRGRLQVPWARALGTAPWALARQVRGRAVYVVLRRRRAGAYDALVASLATGPTPVYVGTRWLPRHVVLAVAVADGVVTCYEPASGRRTRFTREAWLRGRLQGCGGWPVPWAVVSRGPRPARRTPA
ncbi:hypothetical protein [Nocardioides sp. Soil805]|uniref:hypothetical protein n=1 Tax=Nocardioides sp. Soil805 TaxID=1736416 RepID=UPI000702B4E6|nr:hypothetical protein [Nocardioides sp. Soil805]KRF35394.1 hypothetical protein ASG94_14965 [Nocardioides sp. Soil805]